MSTLTTDQKAARAAYAREYRKTHPDKRKGKRSEYTARYRETEGYKEARRRYRSSEKYREKEKRRRAREANKISARCAVKDARRAGKLIKPRTCSSCGCLGNIQAHHDDYDKPLDVRWLCCGCHRIEHRRAAA